MMSMQGQVCFPRYDYIVLFTDYRYIDLFFLLNKSGVIITRHDQLDSNIVSLKKILNNSIRIDYNLLKTIFKIKNNYKKTFNKKFNKYFKNILIKD